MDSHLILELLAILLLVLANGFFALSEFSIIASRTSKLRQKAQEGKIGARTAERIRKKPERFLATIQVGITLVGSLVGVFSGVTIVSKVEQLIAKIPVAQIADAATPIAVAIVVIFITVLSVVLGELVPKYLALSFPERFARYVARPIRIFIKITSVFSRFLSDLANLIIRLLGVRRDSTQGTITEDEINQMILEGRDKGVFDETEEEFVRSVFEFADSTVRRALKPRPDVIAFDINARSEDIVRTITEEGYSRYPIYEGAIDKVVGIIYTKDLIFKQVDLKKIVLADILREPFFVPDSMPLSKLLREFQKGKNHMAIVLDEFGGTAGIITMEDILEELVGEIQDEYDDGETAPLVKHADNIAFADGSVWPGEINELLGGHLPEDDVDTLAGLFIDTLGRLPDKLESIQIADIKMTILEKDENRILRLRLEKIPPDKPVNR
ncbi:MAG: HlyC/CorC family transporter [candidate division Zixibacteria bacterium]|nr:HlyC/CorC family transporter [candidate division Zixibacteria bacterium]